MTNLDQGARRRTLTKVVATPPALSGLVEQMWLDEWPRASRFRRWRIVADDAPHIICHLPAKPDRHSELNVTVVGARTTHYDVDLSNRSATAGVRLRPGALRALFDRSAVAFTDRSLPLDRLVSGDVARSLRALRTTDVARVIDHLSELIESLARHGVPIDQRALRIAQREPTRPARVDEMMAELGMRDRSFRAWSSTHLGMPLKSFMKIRRLHGALEMRLASSEQSWSQIAAIAGYADQSHLIRDCRALLGESPGTFMARAS